MKESKFETIKVGDRVICVGGVGKLFYQHGFPISMSIDKLAEKNIEVSILHVADECMKNGWSAKTTLNKLMGELDIDISGSMKNIDWDLVKKFCSLGEPPVYNEMGGYEYQRDMIYDYLFGGDSTIAMDSIKDILKHE